MMKIVPVKIQGLKCLIDDLSVKKHFESSESKFTKVYGVAPHRTGGLENGRMMWQKITQKIYKSVPKKGFWVGFGGIMWLNSHSEDISFRITEILPSRGSIRDPLLIPDELKNSSKFKVKGKERFYFYEALSACFIKPQGTIKLPTGGGKTFIEIILAYNQSNYIGTGMILVPTLIIKDQFIESANKIGIKIIDYKDLESKIPKGTIFISTHHIICSDLNNKEKKQSTLTKLNLVDWVILDEVAHATSNSWFEILLNLNNCQRCHGFSALPVAYETNGSSFDEMNSDDARTIGIIGSVIYEKSADDLREFLNLPELITLPYTWPPGNNSTNWAEVRNLITENKDRTEFLAQIFNFFVSNGYKVATFVSQKKHAEEILKYCNNSKVACWFGSGVAFTIDQEIEPEDLKKYFGTKYLGLILTSHGIEGLDFDNPLNVLILHEGKSVRQTVQKVGRIVRPDSKPSIILNLVDKGCIILNKHSKIRNEDIINEFKSSLISCTSLVELKEVITSIETKV